eukprot:TRINITY_DN4723_c0_g2_i2.p1 TRINITY_DN4723_c0_g2~~TRINITY_DN4723_c0_g2_i2.p1  ORF type:complete len:770 (+),score=163.77 TRINITY_DN4723_c0_g2_i2:132-2441(+)
MLASLQNPSTPRTIDLTSGVNLPKLQQHFQTPPKRRPPLTNPSLLILHPSTQPSSHPSSQTQETAKSLCNTTNYSRDASPSKQIPQSSTQLSKSPSPHIDLLVTVSPRVKVANGRQSTIGQEKDIFHPSDSHNQESDSANRFASFTSTNKTTSAAIHPRTASSFVRHMTAWLQSEPSHPTQDLQSVMAHYRMAARSTRMNLKSWTQPLVMWMQWKQSDFTSELQMFSDYLSMHLTNSDTKNELTHTSTIGQPSTNAISTQNPMSTVVVIVGKRTRALTAQELSDEMDDLLRTSRMMIQSVEDMCRVDRQSPLRNESFLYADLRYSFSGFTQLVDLIARIVKSRMQLALAIQRPGPSTSIVNAAQSMLQTSSLEQTSRLLRIAEKELHKRRLLEEESRVGDGTYSPLLNTTQSNASHLWRDYSDISGLNLQMLAQNPPSTPMHDLSSTQIMELAEASEKQQKPTLIPKSEQKAPSRYDVSYQFKIPIPPTFVAKDPLREQTSPPLLMQSKVTKDIEGDSLEKVHTSTSPKKHVDKMAKVDLESIAAASPVQRTETLWRSSPIMSRGEQKTMQLASSSDKHGSPTKQLQSMFLTESDHQLQDDVDAMIPKVQVECRSERGKADACHFTIPSPFTIKELHSLIRKFFKLPSSSITVLHREQDGNTTSVKSSKDLNSLLKKHAKKESLLRLSFSCDENDHRLQPTLPQRFSDNASPSLPEIRPFISSNTIGIASSNTSPFGIRLPHVTPTASPVPDQSAAQSSGNYVHADRAR